MCRSITKLPTKNYVLSLQGYDSTDIINICYGSNIKLCSEKMFTTDNSRKYAHSWKNEMQKNIFYAETCDK